MFQVGDTILSEKIATERFICDITRCKGACCVVGESGAPVDEDEIAHLEQAYQQLKERMLPEAVEIVESEGLILRNSENGYEINCIESGECVFATVNSDGVATCTIQEAFQHGEFSWEKPISCHLYPIRLNRISGTEYANFEYIPDLCSAACDRGEETGTYLSEFLEDALVRRYGKEWVDEFEVACQTIRDGEG